MVWSAKSDRNPGACAERAIHASMTGFRCYLCAQCSQDMRTCSKPWTGSAANARPTSGVLRCPDSMLEGMHAATEPITRNPPRIHDRGSTGRMC